MLLWEKNVGSSTGAEWRVGGRRFRIPVRNTDLKVLGQEETKRTRHGVRRWLCGRAQRVETRTGRNRCMSRTPSRPARETRIRICFPHLHCRWWADSSTNFCPVRAPKLAASIQQNQPAARGPSVQECQPFSSRTPQPASGEE